MISFSNFSQSYKDSSNLHIKNGLMLMVSSSLPFFVSYQTFNNGSLTNQRKMYGIVWFSFGVVLNSAAICEFKMARDYRKMNRQ
jgi:hypothetical protein